MEKFHLQSKFQTIPEQTRAVDDLVENLLSGEKAQVLLGVTGSGKTFTLANVVEKVNRPTLVISHNKTLAAQLYGEFKEFFPNNAVEYFVSYYDYYQPEAYVPQTDVYIEKDASINDRLDRLRLSATTSLMSRRDVLIVASVSCIYNLGSPQDYKESLVYLSQGQTIDRDEVLLWEMTSVGRLTFSTTLARVKVFPLPVTPSKTCAFSPLRRFSTKSSTARVCSGIVWNLLWRWNWFIVRGCDNKKNLKISKNQS